jgi:hypothetical protein
MNISIEKNTPSELAMQRAAQVWCSSNNSHKVVDIELTTNFAKILDEAYDVIRNIRSVGHNKDYIFCGLKDRLTDKIKPRVEKLSLKFVIV